MAMPASYAPETPRVTLQTCAGCLVALVQIDLYSTTLDRFRDDVLAAVAAEGRIHGLLIDLSGVAILDAYAYNRLCDVLTMARVMGVAGVLTGIRPGVAWTLVDLEVDVRRHPTRASLDDGMDFLAALRQPQVGADEAPEEERELRAQDDTDAAVAKALNPTTGPRG